jgi:hypothetical protein
MKNYLAIYVGTREALEKSGWTALGEAERKSREARGVAAWGQWVERNASAIVDRGSPCGKTKQVSVDGIQDTTNNIAAYVIVRAESHADAARLFENHPHFAILPGHAVEIMECLPMPTTPG